MSEAVRVVGTSKRNCFIVWAFKYTEDVVLVFVAETLELAEIAIQKILNAEGDWGLHTKPTSREDFHINEIALIGTEILRISMGSWVILRNTCNILRSIAELWPIMLLLY